jgi:hypothetical protein
MEPPFSRNRDGYAQDHEEISGEEWRYVLPLVRIVCTSHADQRDDKDNAPNGAYGKRCD